MNIIKWVIAITLGTSATTAAIIGILTLFMEKNMLHGMVMFILSGVLWFVLITIYTALTKLEEYEEEHGGDHHGENMGEYRLSF